MTFESSAVRSLLRASAVGVALALPLLASSTASAQPKLGIDIGADLPNNSGSKDGLGFGLRLGHQWNLAIIKIIPEIGFDYHDFGGPPDVTAFRFVGGGRVGVDLGIEPLVFAHAGIGHWSGVGASDTNLGYDVGAALDLTMLPIVSFGAHVMETGIAGGSNTDSFNWLEIGGHIGVTLGI
ncbi:MAG TPA: hypothetical protein VMI54_22790 [Polyangiaceae bacterium]|nr:hypothetical protein [Polyangiaceae bacterium]